MIKNKYLYTCLLAGFTTSTYADFSALDQKVKFFNNWVVACNNQGECALDSLPPQPVKAQTQTATETEDSQDEQVGFYLEVSRKAAADSPVMLKIEDWSDEEGDFAEDEPMSLTIDKQSFKLGKLKAKQVEEASFSIPTDKVTEILMALQTGSQLELKVGEASLPVSLQGFKEALQYIDEQQQRLDTSTALVKKGDKPFTATPPQVATITPVKTDETLSDEQVSKLQDKAHELPLVKECLAKADKENALPDAILPLDNDHQLFVFNCESDQYNQKSLVLIAPKDKPEQAELAQFDQGVDKGLITGETVYDGSMGLLTSYYRKSDLGDCGNTAQWAWTGKNFILTSYDTMPECHGVLSFMNVWKLKVPGLQED